MADDRIFSVEIITPDRIFYQGEAEMIEFTTVNGEIGVYKNHIPLTTVLAPGIVTITGPEGKKEAAVHSGFAEILQDKGKVTAAIAKAFAESEFEKYRVIQGKNYQSDFDQLMEETAETKYPN